MSEFVETLQWWLAHRPDLTPTGLGVRAGMGKTMVRQIIINDRSPRIDTVQKICEVLGVSLDQFFARDLDGRRQALMQQLDRLSDAEVELLLAVAREAASRRQG